MKAVVRALLGAACLCSSAAFASGDDAFALRLKDRAIEAFSDASARGDQTATNALLDDGVLFSSGDGNVQHDPAHDASDAFSQMLERRRQALSDALVRGDATAAGRDLDADALFVNEDGIVLGRRDVLRVVSEHRGPAPAVAISGWILHEAGDVAVASFTEERAERYGSQLVDFEQFTIDTWIKRGAEWKLYGSQTIPVFQDPPAVTLPPASLADYAGTFTGGTALSVTIAVAASGLSVTIGGGKPVVYAAEVPDVFFARGVAPGSFRQRIVFQRDAQGAVTRLITSRGLELTKSAAKSAAGPAAAQTPGITSKVLPAADLIVRHAGDIAFAAFVHERVTDYGGQVVHTKFRSTETWIERGTTWKMLTLQSRELEAPPVATTLPAGALGAYAGTYTAEGGTRVTIIAGSAGLILQTGEAPGTFAVPEARDFFTASASPRHSLIFQRDSAGHLTGFEDCRDGRTIRFNKQ